MPRFLVAIHHPHDFDAAVSEDASIHHDIDVLNDQMVEAGIRLFVGGLQPIAKAKGLRASAGKVNVTDGPYLETKEHVGGFWVLELPNMEEALEWGAKAVVACRAPVEVRQFN